MRLPAPEKREWAQRLTRHRANTDANPLTAADVRAWVVSLNGLDSAIGKAEQLAVCRDLLAHAPEDDMLDSDARIIKQAIQDLEHTLGHDAHPPTRKHTPVRRPRLGDRRHGPRPGQDLETDADADAD